MVTWYDLGLAIGHARWTPLNTGACIQRHEGEGSQGPESQDAV
jgi:hypothetical protein